MLETGRAPTQYLPGWLTRPSAPWRLINVVLLVTVMAAGLAAYFAVGRQSAAKAQVTTGTVQRGSVLSTVSASGNVQPARSISLSFQGSGTLVGVYVQKGDHVRKGQPLAKLDDTSQAAAVRTARASLTSSQANLASLQAPLTAATRRQNQVAEDQAQAGIANQKTAVRDTQTSAGQDRASLQKAVVQAQVGLTQAQKAAATNAVSLRNGVGEAKGAWLEAQAAAANDAANLQAAVDQANAQLARDQAQLASDQNDVTSYTSQVSDTTGSVNAAQAQVDEDNQRITDDKKKQHNKGCDQNPVPNAQTCSDLAYQLTKDQSQLSTDQTKLSTAQANQKTAQSNLDAATAAVTSDQSKIVGDQTAITNTQSAQTTGKLKDAQSVTQAYRAWVNAQQSRVAGLHTNAQSIQQARNSLKIAQQALQAGITKDNQSVHNAKASLKSAQQSLQSTLAANAAKAESATPGQLASARAQITSAEANLQNALAAEAQTTLRAPAAGTVAAVNGAVGETPGGAASSSSSSSSTGFVTLVDLDRPEVLASFSETDAAKIRVGQAATVTVDALPNTQLAAHVVNIDTTQTVVNNVVTYGVTLLLDRTVAGLKPGMTVSAAVIVDKRDGVLHVPNAAVRTTGGQSFVTVVDAKGAQSEQAVQTSLVGDDATEIVSGLKAGQEVVVSTISALTTTTGGGRGGGLGGGGVFRFGGPGG